MNSVLAIAMLYNLFGMLIDLFLFMRTMKGKKAEMGIGTLIIFIAGIFVAGIAANVLIQTATSLQSKALNTATGAQKSVSTRMQLIHLSSFDGSETGLKFFEGDVKLIPGSESISLENTLVSIDLVNASINLVYSDEACSNVSDSTGDGYFTDSDFFNGTFTVDYIITREGHQDGYLQRGEMATLCFASSRYILEDEDVSIRITPQYGSPTSVEVVTPGVMTVQRVKLFP